MDETGVHVIEWPKMPLGVNMMHNEGKVIPICLTLCEPICARSSYKLSINLLGQPFAEIVLAGTTKLFNCKEENEGTTIITHKEG